MNLNRAGGNRKWVQQDKSTFVVSGGRNLPCMWSGTARAALGCAWSVVVMLSAIGLCTDLNTVPWSSENVADDLPVPLSGHGKFRALARCWWRQCCRYCEVQNVACEHVQQRRKKCHVRCTVLAIRAADSWRWGKHSNGTHAFPKFACTAEAGRPG